MTPNPEAYLYRPTVTFQDTNVVGNVYFLTFFRWQAECRDRWLRSTRPELWRDLRSDKRPLVVVHWSNRFEDAFGATIGDNVSVTLTTAGDAAELNSVDLEITKFNDEGASRLAVGAMRFATSAQVPSSTNDYPIGRCYSHEAARPCGQPWNPMELLGWQGKCREAFLAEHAAETLRSVAQRELILQTSLASLDLICIPPFPLDDVRVEMRLETIKCGRMEVRFDYFAEEANGGTVRFARGRQKMSSKRARGAAVVPCVLPIELLSALRAFTDSDQLQAQIYDIWAFSSTTKNESEASIDRTKD